MVEMETALLNLEAKLALVPLAPVPVLAYSANTTLPVFGVVVLHCDHPALLMTELRLVL
jgi:hypothetical protein